MIKVWVVLSVAVAIFFGYDLLFPKHSSLDSVEIVEPNVSASPTFRDGEQDRITSLLRSYFSAASAGDETQISHSVTNSPFPTKAVVNNHLNGGSGTTDIEKLDYSDPNIKWLLDIFPKYVRDQGLIFDRIRDLKRFNDHAEANVILSNNKRDMIPVYVRLRELSEGEWKLFELNFLESSNELR